MVSTVGPVQESPVLMIKLSDLYLDAQNPRRTSSNIDLDQSALIEELYQLYDISDLLASLCSNGYFSEEPLIAIPRNDEDSDTAKYTVVEGNRRLAALKILLIDEFRSIANPRAISGVPDDVLRRLNPVPVKVYGSREQVLPYLGVRHIAGTKPWDAFAKARYVANLVEAGESHIEVARRIGSGRRTDVVRKWLLTLYSMYQANDHADIQWDIAEHGFGFSWLYTSIGYRSIRDYLGLTQQTYSEPHREPIPEDCLEHLVQHMRDLYGPPPGNSREAVIKESREISSLAKIYGHTEALGTLRAGASLAEALKKTVNERGQLLDSLRSADLSLASANSLAPNHKGEDEAIRYARRCSNLADALVKTLAE